MPTTKLILFSLLLYIAIGCAPKQSDPENPLEKAIQSEHPKIKPVIDSAAHYQVQIMLSTSKRDNTGVKFTDYQFCVNDSNYFYPASSVKLPISLLALEKLNKDPRFDRNTLFYIDGDTIETTFANEINKSEERRVGKECRSKRWRVHN